MGHAVLLYTCLVNLQLFKLKRKNKDIFICESELGTDLNFCAFNTRKKKDSAYNTWFIFMGFIAKRGWVFVDLVVSLLFVNSVGKFSLCLLFLLCRAICRFITLARMDR